MLITAQFSHDLACCVRASTMLKYYFAFAVSGSEYIILAISPATRLIWPRTSFLWSF